MKFRVLYIFIIDGGARWGDDVVQIFLISCKAILQRHGMKSTLIVYMIRKAIGYTIHPLHTASIHATAVGGTS